MSNVSVSEFHVDLTNSFGATQIGVAVATFLCGMLTLQTFIYFQAFSKDPWITRMTVGIVWVLDTIHLGIVVAYQYHYVINNYHFLPALPLIHWTFGVGLILTNIITFIVQGFFIYRTKLISKSNLIAAAIFVLALLSFATGIACASISLTLLEYTDALRFKWLASIWLGCAAATDLAITAALGYSLYSSRTGFKETDNLLTKLIIWTVNTGALTSLAAILDLCFFLRQPDLIYYSFGVVLAKIYANTLMATLNQRVNHRRVVLTSGGGDDVGRVSTTKNGQHNIHIYSNTETVTDAVEMDLVKPTAAANFGSYQPYYGKP